MQKLSLGVLAIAALSTATLTTACASSAPQSDRAQAGVPLEPTAGDEALCGESQVFFASGSAELDEAAVTRLDSYAGCIERHALDTIYVTGMTDPAGDADTNLALGRARARAVADHLRARGTTGQFVIRSWGEQDALENAPLWPLERNAVVTAVRSESDDAS